MHDKYGNLKTSSSFTMFPLPKTFASSFLALTMMCGFRNSSVIAHSIVFEVLVWVIFVDFQTHVQYIIFLESAFTP
ncbi:hypothetical protein HanXRQr2_Chr02g0061811 [Helianthus annuus]|uniref:Uncharacterized protein n=1 Tax=Helianthus annuus TaxID=4232 RepID=A0A9K3JN88_HELAN|nr:hypothetical protein HanXRQr2_Chr02g0061811 [Helianthus annuus]KAJ0951501.1 hypothetical protein HanPSC8_Chr02g0060811 [Helianthus annuus]